MPLYIVVLSMQFESLTVWIIAFFFFFFFCCCFFQRKSIGSFLNLMKTYVVVLIKSASDVFCPKIRKLSRILLLVLLYGHKTKYTIFMDVIYWVLYRPFHN